jgi:hypothetical protein
MEHEVRHKFMSELIPPFWQDGIMYLKKRLKRNLVKCSPQKGGINSHIDLRRALHSVSLALIND